MRLFFALVPPEELCRALDRAARQLAAGCGRGRPVRRENLHLTLAFLGETERRRRAEAAMDRALVPAFPLRTAHPGRFSGRDGALWWVGFAPSPPLLEFRRRLAEALEEEGLWYDPKPFRAHLTLGRGLSPRPEFDLEAWGAQLPGRRWWVDRAVLMESRREAGGLRYIPLRTWALRK